MGKPICKSKGCKQPRALSYLCEQHDKKCSVSSCHQQAQEGLGDSDRCLKHKRCQSSVACNGFVSSSGHASQWSPYCERHKCRQPFCAQERAEQLSRPEGEPYGLCLEHLRKFLCIAEVDPPCYNPARKNGQDDFCAIHSLCIAQGCQTDRRSDSPLCNEHKCNRISCPREADKIIKFCQDHRCTGFIEKHGKREPCKLPTVNGPIGEYLQYCAQHCCQYNVRDDRLCPEYNENQSYCNDHRCIVEDCNHARLIGIEADSPERCLKHMKRDSGVGVETPPPPTPPRSAMPGGF